MQTYEIVIKGSKKENLETALTMLNDAELREIASNIAIKQKAIQNTLKDRNQFKTLLVSMGMTKENLVDHILTSRVFNFIVKANPLKSI
jgi:predicted DNA-binding protein YlxM (UPF0122 family)